MTDVAPVTPVEKPVKRSIRTYLALALIAFSLGAVAFLLYAGDGENSLHTSALAWSFANIWLTAAGLGILSFTTATIEAFRK